MHLKSLCVHGGLQAFALLISELSTISNASFSAHFSHFTVVVVEFTGYMVHIFENFLIFSNFSRHLDMYGSVF